MLTVLRRSIRGFPIEVPGTREELSRSSAFIFVKAMSTTFRAKVDRVVDGDTVRVFLPGQEGGRSEPLRILSLDTEETRRGSKPKTEMGHRAKRRAEDLIRPGDEVELAFPGNEPLDVAMRKYRGNWGRLLVHLKLADGNDFQEIMISEGFSPYFSKYGYADLPERHERYVQAERVAQSKRLGVWDQIRNNGLEARNYGALCTWWDLRARVIQEYRQIGVDSPDDKPLNTRRDYANLLHLESDGEPVTVFTELRRFWRRGDGEMVFSSGSRKQPFELVVRESDSPVGEATINLLLERFIARGEERPRRGYLYARGILSNTGDEGDTKVVLDVHDSAHLAGSLNELGEV